MFGNYNENKWGEQNAFYSLLNLMLKNSGLQVEKQQRSEACTRHDWRKCCAHFRRTQMYEKGQYRTNPTGESKYLMLEDVRLLRKEKAVVVKIAHSSLCKLKDTKEQRIQPYFSKPSQTVWYFHAFLYFGSATPFPSLIPNTP